MKLEQEQQINLLLLLATFKSLTEQLYNLKGLHSGIVKKKFNRLQNAFNSYEKELNKTWLKDNYSHKEVIEQLNDAITDLLYMLREGVETVNTKKTK